MKITKKAKIEIMNILKQESNKFVRVFMAGFG
jgi:hypothetical protein